MSAAQWAGVRGRTVTVFEDPITRQRPEGEAKILRVLSDCGWYDDERRPLLRCLVRFTDDGAECERDVSDPR